MNVQEAKQELRQCSYIMLEIENLEELIQRKLQKLDIQPMQLTDMPRSGSANKDKILSTLGQVEGFEEMKNVIQHQEFIENVQRKISKLQLSQERTLLRMRYLQNMQFKEITYRFNCSIRCIHQIHATALVNYSVCS